MLNLTDELSQAEERRMNKLFKYINYGKNFERQQFDTTSAENVALCDMLANIDSHAAH